MVIDVEVIGIIGEYNPFHSGHKYHINKVKEIYPDSILVAVISTSFTQRGNISVLNKWDKTNILLDNNIDLVIELPFVYSTQSADKFAYGALKILNEIGIDRLVFGSECNDINLLKEIASLQINNKQFDLKVKKYLDEGNNYPTSLSLAIKDFNIKKIDSPNDLLGISYIKEILKNNYNIIPLCIKRSNSFHGNNKGIIKSASELREFINKNKDIKKYINYDENLIYKNIDEFNLLKYKIITSDIKNYMTVDEGIEGRIYKYIMESSNKDELIKCIKTKRYTYNKINRMLTHILCCLTKDEANLDIDYIRILGFNSNGKSYLNKIKKNTSIPFVTRYKDTDSKLLDIEYKVLKIYSIIANDKSLIKKELSKPIYK